MQRLVTEGGNAGVGTSAADAPVLGLAHHIVRVHAEVHHRLLAMHL